MSGKQTAELIAVLKDNWQAEMKGYYTYQTLSDAETDPHRRNAFRGLAAAERHHADLWSKRLKELDGSTLVYRGKQTGDAETLASTLSGSFWWVCASGETRAGLDVARQLGRKHGRKRQMTESEIRSAKNFSQAEWPPRDLASNSASPS